MGAVVYQFTSHEDAELDTSRILTLRQSLGDQRCREVVEEVVFHLSDRIGLLNAALENDDTVEARPLAARLASLSEQVGLADFARVARDLAQCLANADSVATGAVSARLQRLGEESLLNVILYADQSAL